MIIIKGKNADELFKHIARELQKVDETVSPRGLQTRELYQAWLELDNPEMSIVNLKGRGLNYDYLVAEMKWYKSGSLDVKDIESASKFWTKLADTNGTINSNYGFMVFKDKFAGKSQYEWCRDSLKNDPDGRQAVINYNQPKHKYDGNKDFVCTMAQHFIKRNGALDSIVFMRSNDLIYGLSYDLPWFTHVQKSLAKDLNLPLGKYYHFATSLHVYKKHYGLIDAMAFDKEQPDKTWTLSDLEARL